MIEAKKSLGQNFLNSPHVPEQMVRAAELGEDETVLEVGPGTGVLTEVILKHAARVVAVEADARAVSFLEERFSDEIKTGKLTIVHGDVREVDLADYGFAEHEFVVIANIPYYLSGFLFRYFLSGALQPHTLVFLVQKEVAQRIAREKKSSLLSLSVEVYGTPKYITTVKRGNFTPPPKVDSAIIAIYGISRRRFEDSGISEDLFFELLHLGFAGKRKQLRGELSKKYPREHFEEVLTACNLSETVRAEDMNIDEWFHLVQALEKET